MHNNLQSTLPDIRQTVEINAPINKVWLAASTSEGLANWLMPNDLQAKVGNEFTLQTQFGPVACKVLELDAPNRISFSWDDFGWIISFELKQLEGKTQFTVIHSGWGKPNEIIPLVSEKVSVIRERMDIGWGYLTSGLRDKLSEE